MLRILFVDDQPDFRVLFSHMMKPYSNAEIQVGASSAEAIQKMKTGREFDLVICDYQMPGGSGAEVLDHMNATQSPGYFILCTCIDRRALPQISGPRLMGIVGKTEFKRLIELLGKCRSLLTLDPLESAFRPEQWLQTPDEKSQVS